MSLITVISRSRPKIGTAKIEVGLTAWIRRKLIAHVRKTREELIYVPEGWKKS